MANSMKKIKLRMKSVQNTMQITKAMELVASGKLRRARERVEHSRPYFETLYETLFSIASEDDEFASPYLERRERRKRLYIVIAGDRGLAGGYNANLLRAVEADISGSEYCILPIGRKAVEYFMRHGDDIVSTDFVQAGDLSVSDCFEVSRFACQGFLRGDFDEIRIAFTRFVSMLAQTPVLLPVLPFDAPDKEAGKTRKSLMLYEPDRRTVFDAIIPEYLAGVVYGSLCESTAAEHAARRMAMESATDNASELMEHLNLYYNRARQAAITREITEIVAGADAEA